MSSKKKTITLGNISKKDSELLKAAIKNNTTQSKQDLSLDQQSGNSLDKPNQQPCSTMNKIIHESQKKANIKEKDNDLNTFKQYMKGVKPLDKKNISHGSTVKRNDFNKAYKRTQAEKINTNPGDELSDYIREPVNSDQKLAFYRPGLQIRIFEKLKSGQMNIDAVIDLHGRTVDEARHNLARFLKHCFINNRCCIKVIHGKNISNEGKYPLIKTLINEWLPQVEYVMAFCSALPHDGGTGASYVLLKRCNL